jgi:hypothetical protein
MVPICLSDPGNRVLLLARTGFALAALLGPAHVRVSLSHLWIDSMRSRVGPRELRVRDPREPNDIHRLSRRRAIRRIRDWHTLVRITALAPNRRSSQDQAGIQPAPDHRGYRQLDLSAH